MTELIFLAKNLSKKGINFNNPFICKLTEITISVPFDEIS
jgi:hypothetical protein